MHIYPRLGFQAYKLLHSVDRFRDKGQLKPDKRSHTEERPAMYMVARSYKYNYNRKKLSQLKHLSIYGAVNGEISEMILKSL